jgi:hypothetical protein
MWTVDNLCGHGKKQDLPHYTYIPFTLYPPRGSRDNLDISSKITYSILCNQMLKRFFVILLWGSVRSSMASRSVHFGVRSRKLSNVGQSLDRWPKIYYLELLRASESTLSGWSRLHLTSLAPTNPHWAHVVGYGPFFLYVIHKEGMCPSSWDDDDDDYDIHTNYLAQIKYHYELVLWILNNG